jgi:hypothetical protein
VVPARKERCRSCSTWAPYGKGVDVDRDAILAAERWLADHGGTTDIGRALYAYNGSDDYVAYRGLRMAADAREYHGYSAWQVYVTTTAGTQRLAEGWRAT